MFEGFAHVWTPVDLSSRLRNKPLPVAVGGERLVLFRGAQGKVSALFDQCPHRGVALSLGKVTADGCLECPFHGWQFSGDGTCTHVPLNPETKRERLFARSVPARDLGGFLWVYTAPVAVAPTEPTLPEALTDSAFRLFPLVKIWNAHWTRAMENMLDSPHLPFVHRRTIGLSMRRTLTRETAMEISYETTPTGARSGFTWNGAPGAAFLEFNRPNNMVLHIPIPNKRMRIQVWCVPLGPTQTKMIVVGARDFGRYNPFAAAFDRINHLIVHEDRAVVESSSPPEVPPPGDEVSVPTDRATLQFRKYYYDVLKYSSAEGGATGKSRLTRVAS